MTSDRDLRILQALGQHDGRTHARTIATTAAIGGIVADLDRLEAAGLLGSRPSAKGPIYWLTDAGTDQLTTGTREAAREAAGRHQAEPDPGPPE